MREEIKADDHPSTFLHPLSLPPPSERVDNSLQIEERREKGEGKIRERDGT